MLLRLNSMTRMSCCLNGFLSVYTNATKLIALFVPADQPWPLPCTWTCSSCCTHLPCCVLVAAGAGYDALHKPIQHLHSARRDQHTRLLHRRAGGGGGHGNHAVPQHTPGEPGAQLAMRGVWGCLHNCNVNCDSLVSACTRQTQAWMSRPKPIILSVLSSNVHTVMRAASHRVSSDTTLTPSL
jgi:hypothetical protein